MKVNWRMGAVLLASTLAAVLAMPGPAAAKPRPLDTAHQQARASAMEQTMVAAAEAPGLNIWSEDPDAAGKCVDVWNVSGPWIQMWGCHGGANQQWSFVYRLNGIYEVQTYLDGTYYCIDGYAGRGRQLIRYRCDGSNDQKFKLSGNRYGVFSLESVRHPGQCMDIYDWGRGTPVQLWDCHRAGDRSNQLWHLS